MLKYSKAAFIGAMAIAAGLSGAAQAFEPSEYDRMSRPVGFDDDRRDPQRPIGFTRRDANDNRVHVTGASSLAAGNLIAVTVEGSGNVVKIDADQDNSGDVESKLILNGNINLSR